MHKPEFPRWLLMFSPTKPKNFPEEKISLMKRSTRDDFFFRSASRTCPNLPKPRGRPRAATAINLPQLFFGDQSETLADFGLHIVAKFSYQVHVNFSGHACKPCGRAARQCFCTPDLSKNCFRQIDKDFTKIRQKHEKHYVEPRSAVYKRK